jgi:hypothetical protein
MRNCLVDRCARFGLHELNTTRLWNEWKIHTKIKIDKAPTKARRDKSPTHTFIFTRVRIASRNKQVLRPTNWNIN